MSRVTHKLAELADFLTREDLTLEEVVARVGQPRSPRRAGSRQPWVLQSLHPEFSGFELVTVADSGQISFLGGRFAPGHAPTVGELQAAFGRYDVVEISRDLPVPLLFANVSHGKACSVTLIADLPTGSVPSPEARVEAITLRRDPA